MLYNASLVDSNGRRIPFHTSIAKASGESHGREYDAIRLRFQIDPKYAEKVYAFEAQCSDRNPSAAEDSNRIRVFYRKRELNDHIVVCISQFYRYAVGCFRSDKCLILRERSHIAMVWFEVYLRHYFAIGVDFIVMFTAFQDKDAGFAREVDKLIAEKYPKSVVRYDWSMFRHIKTWARGQDVMINHAGNVFGWVSIPARL